MLTYRYVDYTLIGLASARTTHAALSKALGVTDEKHFPDVQGAGHVMGTHRMGADPKRSVTDAAGRTHDHLNLYLAGAGLFPTTGTGNLTLTIAALALRSAAAMAADLGLVIATPVATPAG